MVFVHKNANDNPGPELVSKFLKEPSQRILSCFGRRQNYLEIEGNLKIIVYKDGKPLKVEKYTSIPAVRVHRHTGIIQRELFNSRS